MPPRLQATSLPASIASCPSIRSQPPSQPLHISRQFSQTSCQRETARRRAMYAWLNGPGRAFKDPIPGSTNYMNAYNLRNGKLKRAPADWRRPVPEWRKSPRKGLEQQVKKPVDTQGEGPVDELEKAVRKTEAERDNSTESGLPPEDGNDLRPFPINKYFRSQPVLSEELRDAIYDRVVNDGASVRLASIEFHVSNERVGAVVRLKQLEKQWIAEGKTLAMPYAKAVMDMLPKTPYIDPKRPENKGVKPVVHESINDLVVHPATRQQLFIPVAESREFTRVDASKAFDNNLLPADDRIPHPELVMAEREFAAGLSFRERMELAEARLAAEEDRKKKQEEKKQEELAKLKTIPGRRWDFVFQDVSVEAAGRDGRGLKGVGWRYGFPHEDRKKGQVKIPTKVEA